MFQKPALSLFLSILRLKLLEDSSLDIAPEADPGNDSGAMDGKGERFHCCLLQTCVPVCQTHPYTFLQALLFPVCQRDPSAGKPGDSFCMGKNLQPQEVDSCDSHQKPGELRGLHFPSRGLCRGSGPAEDSYHPPAAGA